MIAATEILDEARSRVAMVEGAFPSLPARACAATAGLGFVCAGFGLWLLPLLDLSALAMLSKLALSILLVMAGVGLAQIAVQKPCRELHFDARNHQLLVVEGLPRGRKRVAQTIRYDRITRVVVSEARLTVLGEDGIELVGLPLEGPHARLDVIAQLRSQTILPL